MAVARASDLGGYFFVGFEGHWSEKVAHDANADEMASALAGIPTVGQVNVRRKAHFSYFRFAGSTVLLLLLSSYGNVAGVFKA